MTNVLLNDVELELIEAITCGRPIQMDMITCYSTPNNCSTN